MNRISRRLRLKPLEDRLAPATLSGSVFADYDGDGVRDAIDRAQAGATVRLDLGGNGSFDTTTTTAADGTYSFAAVADGNHKVVLTTPAGFLASTATSIAIAVAGADAKDLTFGVTPIGSITGIAYQDNNFNGTKDVGEPVLPGVAVLLNLYSDGLSNRNTVTDALGQYSFTGVPAGLHNLQAQLAGFSKIAPNPVNVNVPLSANIAVDLKFAPAAVISGFAFTDANGNGTLDAGERLLPNYTTSLDLNGNGTVDATTLTDTNGQFYFTGVANGSHKVSLANATISPGFRTATVTAAADVSGLGFAVTPVGTLDGMAYNDANANGVQDVGETPLGGVTISIDYYGNSTIDSSVVTGTDGKYSFTGIPDGAHVVSAVRNAFTNTSAASLAVIYQLGAILTPPIVPPPNPRTPGDPITFGPFIPTEFHLAPTAVITGFVYNDANNNGTPNAGESELNGVTVKLDVNNDGTFDATTTTNQYGQFAFTGLANGTHKIAVTLPSGYLSAGALTKVVTLTAGAASKGNGFALTAAAPVRVIAASSDSPAANVVNVFNNTGGISGTFAPFGSPGDTRVATGDVNGDTVEDYAVATGAGRVTTVRVLDGATGTEIFSVQPYGAGFFGGAFVALGDLTGDGRADLAITPDITGGPRVRLFNGNGFAQIADFFGIDDVDFRGGARTAIGDLNSDGKGDLAVAAGFGGGPRVALFDGNQLGLNGGPKFIGDFFAFEPDLRNGAYLAIADTNGDGYGDLIAGAGFGGAPRITVFSGMDLVVNTQTRLADFFAGGQFTDRSGVRVAVSDVDLDGKADIIAAYRSLPSFANRMAAYTGASLSPSAFPTTAFDVEPFPGYLGTVFVG